MWLPSFPHNQGTPVQKATGPGNYSNKNFKKAESFTNPGGNFIDESKVYAN